MSDERHIKADSYCNPDIHPTEYKDQPGIIADSPQWARDLLYKQSTFEYEGYKACVQLLIGMKLYRPTYKGTKAGVKTGGVPNSKYKQYYNGRLKATPYYDKNGVEFTRKDFFHIDGRHKITINGVRYNLKNTPHQHQTNFIQGPNGLYQKRQIRILNKRGTPITGWGNGYD